MHWFLIVTNGYYFNIFIWVFVKSFLFFITKQNKQKFSVKMTEQTFKTKLYDAIKVYDGIIIYDCFCELIRKSRECIKRLGMNGCNNLHQRVLLKEIRSQKTILSLLVPYITQRIQKKHGLPNVDKAMTTPSVANILK